MRLTWAATIRHASSVRIQVCICRPTLPAADDRWNRVDAVPKWRPYVVMTVRDKVRCRPSGERAARNRWISSLPYRFSVMP